MEATTSVRIQSPYTALTTPRAIRILTLHSGTPSDAIAISLDTVTIEQSGLYEALSYSWDDQIPSIAISCNQTRELKITPNVSEALLELRLSNEDRRLWIDQICIDQDNMIERSQQIQLMKDIYLNAQQVVFWLGRAADDSALAFDFLERLAIVGIYNPKEYRTRFVALTDDIEAGIKARCSDSSQALQDALRALPRVWSRDCSALVNLLSRSWFSRLWILQEIVLSSKSSELRCGKSTFSIEGFMLSMVAFRSCGCSAALPVGSAAEDAFLTSLTFSSMRLDRNERHFPYKLSRVLAQTTCQMCKDPRDRVYATLGMCSERYLPYVIPDYTRSTTDVYTAATRAAINVEQSLTIFGQTQRSEERSKDLPSWVPDWRVQRLAFGATLSLGGLKAKPYFIASNHRVPHVVETSSPHRIGLGGLKLGQVTRVLSPRLFRGQQDWNPSGARYEQTSWRKMFLEEAIRLELPPSCIRTQSNGVRALDDILFHHTQLPLGNDELLAIALRRTLTADQYPNSCQLRLEPHYCEACFPHYAMWKMNGPSLTIPHEVLQEHDAFIEQSIMQNRSLCIVSQQRYGTFLCVAPGHVQLGDWVCILYRGDVPVVLRPRTPRSDPRKEDEGQTWELLGEAYVDGMMDGEAVLQPHTDEVFVLD